MPEEFSFGGSQKKIVITGPESCGKTTLSIELAKILKCSVVPEMARDYLNNIDRAYVYEDLYEIAIWQMIREDSLLPKKASRISDTDLLTLKIWSLEKFGKCDPRIENEFVLRKPKLYLLCAPDVPWKSDPLRENADDRKRLYERYKSELDAYHYPYIEISGLGEERMTNAIEQMKAFFSNK